MRTEELIEEIYQEVLRVHKKHGWATVPNKVTIKLAIQAFLGKIKEKV